MSNENAYKHGLRRSSDTFEQAADRSDKWINDHINAARNAKTRDESLNEFGGAFHTVSDETSPSHTGYQVWDGAIDDGLLRALPSWGIHVLGEASIDAFHMGFAIAATQKLYLETYGADALYEAVGDPNVFGTANDPAVKELETDIRQGYAELDRVRHHDMGDRGAVEMAIGEAIYNYNLGLNAGWTFDYHRQSNLAAIERAMNQQRGH